jgi:hypothetical protein
MMVLFVSNVLQETNAARGKTTRENVFSDKTSPKSPPKEGTSQTLIARSDEMRSFLSFRL